MDNAIYDNTQTHESRINPTQKMIVERYIYKNYFRTRIKEMKNPFWIVNICQR